MTNLSKADLEAIATMILKMGGKAPKAKQQASKKPANTSKKAASPKGERKDEFVAATLKAFEKAGFTNNIPHETVLTYGKWEAKGFRPRKGEKAVRVKLPGLKGQGMPLFHISQCEPIAA